MEVEKVMNLVPKDQMTELFTAAQSRQTATTAEDDIQLKAVAFAINSAANTGQLRVIFQEPLREAVKEQLEGSGYTIQYISAAKEEQQALISWKGDDVKKSQNNDK